jgi:hypothetical protein
MISLKAYCLPLSQILGLSPDALYERQRVLARGGHFAGAISGKGPGSGVRATVRNVSRLLLSTLAADALSEIDEKTRKFGAIKQINGKCPFTGENRLQNALEKILGSPELAASVRRLAVRREDLAATITYDADRAYDNSDFGAPRPVPIDPPILGRRITATLEGWSIEMIAQDLRDAASGVPLSNHVPRK